MGTVMISMEIDSGILGNSIIDLNRPEQALSIRGKYVPTSLLVVGRTSFGQSQHYGATYPMPILDIERLLMDASDYPLFDNTAPVGFRYSCMTRSVVDKRSNAHVNHKSISTTL